MSQPFCRGSPSAASRATLPSLRSISLDSQRCDRTVSTYSVAGAARAVEYGGKLRVWTAEMDGRILVRAAPRGETLFEVSARQSAFCTVLRRVAEGQMWAAFSDGFIRCYNSVTGTLEREFVQHAGAVHALASSAVSDYVYSGGEDWKVYQWSRSKCTYIRLFSGHTNRVRCVIVVPGHAGPSSTSAGDDATERDDEDDAYTAADGAGLEDAFVLSCGDDTTVKVWDPKAPLQIKTDEACLATLRGHEGPVLAMEVHPRSGYLWSGGDDCSILVWDWRRGEGRRCVAVLHGQHSGPITSIVHVSPRMWSSAKDGFVVVWNPRELAPIQRIQLAPRHVNCPILSMRRLYRATHWTVWLSGAEGLLQALQVTGDEHDVDAKLQHYEQRRTAEKRRLTKLQAKTSSQKQRINKLKARNEDLEVQLQIYQERNILLLEDTATRLRSNAQSGSSAADGRAAQIKALRTTVLQLEEKVRTNEESITQAAADARQKDEMIQLLSGQLAQKDSALQALEKRLKTLTPGQAPHHAVSKTSPIEKKMMQGKGEAAAGATEDLEASTESLKQLRTSAKLEEDEVQNHLLELNKYKTICEEKEEALLQATEKIEALQCSLDVEKKYVEELLQELLDNPKGHTAHASEATPKENRTPPQTLTPLHASVHHYYRRLPGKYWMDVVKTYPADLQQTLWAEYCEVLSSTDATIQYISPTATNDHLLVDAVLQQQKAQSQDLQCIIEAHHFPRTLKLHEIHANSLQKTPKEESITPQEEYEAVSAAKQKAEAERDNVQQRLRATEEELNSLRQQAEARRAQIAGLPAATKAAAATSPTRSRQLSAHSAAPPLYTVTAEEYEAVSAAKQKAEAERDNVQQRLRATEEELNSLRQQAEARRAQIAGLPAATKAAAAAASP
ncbi:uncharacterized protein Tco025E_05428, partial [Trypanosoma conorhini]